MSQLMLSFEGLTVPHDILAAVERGEVASFCLFGHYNGGSPAQVRALAESLIDAARAGGLPTPLIGLDQEGGQLMALTEGVTELPGNMALGATRSPELAEQIGRVLGRELRAMGINMNFAPSADVNVNPANPVVGTRSFGEDPALVADLAAAMIRGMQAEGVAATAKHFPGHGDVSLDSHYDLSVVPHARERLDAVELFPFRAAIEAGVKAVMTAHVLYPALDADLPATLSPAILTGLLRRELAFDGLIITDAMDMAPAAPRYGALQSARMALEAGADLVMLAHLPDQLALVRDTLDLTRPQSAARIHALCVALDGPLPSLDVVGCAAHRQIAQTVAERAITVVRDGGTLPLQPAPDDSIAVVTPETLNLTPADSSEGVSIHLADAIRRRHPRTQDYTLRHGNGDVAALLAAVEAASVVVVGTISAEHDPDQAALVQALHARDQQVIVVSLRTPYDLSVFPMVETYLCAYGIRDVNTEAVARVLFGEIAATGVLPCAIPGIAATAP
ncbi:beta-N-acetylhexosaminidase [Aggregatilinea lenta]|uniref:beta-N-acetylhexosaminidase n=1 Tax=Aggregatilinea lenta TaxID=913108 RepID=UPI000E5AD822|nr:beta-N-acetylhexosaminidase [Aggregatilinea lenta]